MPAFCLPSFFHGRIRINLIGRESKGVVSPEDYNQTCDLLEKLLFECRDPRTGLPIITGVNRAQIDDPMQLDDSDADLVVIWQGCPNAFEHPRHGVIGPVPFRRTGGHTGTHGTALISGSGMPAGRYGVRSSHDVLPTLAELLHTSVPGQVSGRSMLEFA